MDNYLIHHGILGQKWGVRRYQNKDGTLTSVGYKRYSKAVEKAQKYRDKAEKYQKRADKDWIDRGYAVRAKKFSKKAEAAEVAARKAQDPMRAKFDSDQVKLAKKDSKWTTKNYDKLYKQAYKQSKKELKTYVKDELNPKYAGKKKGAYYRNEYNQKMAELMNMNVSDVTSPSGKVVRFVAKRGDIGVHLALADPGYDMSQVQKGIYNSGRVAYKKDQVDMV